MADEIEVTGKSKYEVAHTIAHNILNAEHGGINSAIKSGGGRKLYLNAVAEAIEALAAIRPK